MAGHQFAGIVVAEAEIGCYFDAAAYCVCDGGEEGRGVEVWGLDEDAAAGVADEGEEGFVLGHVDALLEGITGGAARDDGHGDGCVWCEGRVWQEWKGCW